MSPSTRFTAAKHKEKSRPTLPFPPEIRNEIYQLVLSDPPQKKTVLPKKTWNQKRIYTLDEGPDPSVLQLLLASKQTLLEAYHFFYRSKLYFPSANHLSRFLDNTGYARRYHLTSLAFTFCVEDRMSGDLSMLNSCPNLKSLEVILNEKIHSVPDLLANTLLNVRGLETVRFNDENAPMMFLNGTRCYISGMRPRVYERHELEDLMKRKRSAQLAAKPDEVVDPLPKPRKRASKKMNKEKATQKPLIHPYLYHSRPSGDRTRHRCARCGGCHSRDTKCG